MGTYINPKNTTKENWLATYGVREFEDLPKEDIHAVLCEPLDICAVFAQRLDVANGHAVNTLHCQHIRSTVVPMDLGHIKLLGIRKVAPQLCRIGSLAH